MDLLTAFRGDITRSDLDWQDRALCAQVDPELFFPETGMVPRDAKRVCMACEVRVQCLEYGLYERFGIFGGKTYRERRVICARREREAA